MPFPRMARGGTVDMGNGRKMTNEVLKEIAAFARDPTPGAVLARLERYLARRGYRGFAIGTLPSPPLFEPSGFFHHNWPAAFGEAFIARELGPHDPTQRYARSATRPITLSALARGEGGFALNDREREVLALGASLGRGEGVLVPIFGQHGYRGIVAFLKESGEPGPEELVEFRLLAVEVHDRLNTLHARARPVVHLSEREVDVLRLAKAGCHDSEIAAQLGIAVRTVRFHFSNARTRLGTTTRAATLVTATNLEII